MTVARATVRVYSCPSSLSFIIPCISEGHLSFRHPSTQACTEPDPARLGGRVFCWRHLAKQVWRSTPSRGISHGGSWRFGQAHLGDRYASLGEIVACALSRAKLSAAWSCLMNAGLRAA
jgi:hypothetical protein